ncbi:MAG: CHRD domain-containing protein, partial [Verrucomicrobiales bacterium]
ASITRDAGDVTLAWEGGIGPFIVEAKTDLADAVWKTYRTSVERTITFPAEEHAAFFRVADAAGNPSIGFSVSLSGANERPNPTTSNGSGSGILRLEGNTLSFDISYSGLTTVASAAHFHGPAGANESASVIINLAPFAGPGLGTNGTFSGSVTVTPAQKAMFLAGKTYVNIHTTNNPPGEIRGQVLPVVYSADLNGAAERPAPVSTPARGTGAFLLAGNELTFNINYWNLTGAAIGAHIHGPAKTTNTASILIDLGPYNGGAFGTNGSLVGRVTLTPEQMAYLADGLLYVNIHTPANTRGEIRGQILPAVTAIPYTASMNGAAERPTPVTSDAAGTAIVTLQGQTLSVNANYKGFASVVRNAHFHGPAMTTNAAGVLIHLPELHKGEFSTNGLFAGALQISEEHARLIRAGLTYINIHTVDHPPGEIRGQVAPVLYRSELLGASERVNAVQTSASGTGQLLLIGNRLYLNATYGGITSAARAAHIHGPAASSTTASVIIDIEPILQGDFGMAGSFAGFRDLSTDHLGYLIDERTYINVHSNTNTGGEIRGQIKQ